MEEIHAMINSDSMAGPPFRKKEVLLSLLFIDLEPARTFTSLLDTGLEWAPDERSRVEGPA